MKIPLIPQPIAEPKTREELVEWAQTVLLKVLRTELSQIRQAMGALGLENMNWKLATGIAFPNADTDVSVTHDLDFVPNIALPFFTADLEDVFGANSHTAIYKGTTSWTKSTISLRCTRGNVSLTADILIM